LSIKTIITISINIIYVHKKKPHYKSCYMADATVVRAIAPFYILWCPDLWRYAETPHTYKVTFQIDVVYVNTRFRLGKYNLK